MPATEYKSAPSGLSKEGERCICERGSGHDTAVAVRGRGNVNTSQNKRASSEPPRTPILFRVFSSIIFSAPPTVTSVPPNKHTILTEQEAHLS